MNERVMQFRIGMFVIVAGLVLTMMIVWFGESPSLFRDQAYLTVRFKEAPGVAEGIPVRKSGIRIGQVASIQVDDRADHPDGELVTLALARKYTLRAGSVPRITRALIGDVSIDMQPGTGTGPLRTHPTLARPPDSEIVQGQVAADPSKAIEAASEVIASVKGTLQSIDEAAKGLAVVSKKADKLDEMLLAWRDMARSVDTLAGDFNQVVKDNEGNLKPAIAKIRDLTDSFNATFDEPTQASLKSGIQRFSSASVKLDTVLTDLGPAAKDLGAEAGRPVTTTLGQTLGRLNRIAYDVSLLSQALEGPKGGLNSQGSLQKLLLQAELHDNLNGAAKAIRDLATRAKPAVDGLNIFAGKVSRDPAVISRGALQR
jgi:phospholipid/cholesterol/gamma-HCH transport system substrate-binding protein